MKLMMDLFFNRRGVMLLQELKTKGIEVTLLDDNHIKVRPKEKLTPELKLKIAKQKQKIIQALKQTAPKPSFTCPLCGCKEYEWSEEKKVWLCRNCGIAFTHEKEGDPAIKELCKDFEEFLKQHGGYVLVKSRTLNETIAWTLPAYIKHLQDKGYVCYLPYELAYIKQLCPDPDTFRKIHIAKKMFEGKITIQ